MYGFIEPVPGRRPGPRNRAAPDRQADDARHSGQPSWNLHLETADTNVAARFLTDSPSVAVLAIEDLCWQAATEDWSHRRPHWWQPNARAAWRAEGAVLAAKAARLRELADHVLQEL